MLLSAEILKEKILKDKFNSIIFRKGRDHNLFLVGGYVRDALRGIRSADRDYVISDDIKNFVKRINKSLNGTVIEFKKRKIIRLFLKNGATIDISKLKGSLKKDLSKRDFTINAIAWSPVCGLVDPYQGIEDLRKGIVRSISEKNITSDPLRMIRAYRFASELNGSIERSTRNLIAIHHAMIVKTSPERITSELFHLLNSNNPVGYLKMSLSDNLLKTILPLSESILKRNIKVLSQLEEGLKKFPLKESLLEKLFSQNLTYKGLLRLEILLSQDGHFSHDLFPNLRLSKRIVKRITMAHKGMKNFNIANLFEIFYEAKESSIDILILKNRAELLKEHARFSRIWKKGLLTSREISQLSKMKGPKLGQLIMEIKKAQFEGKINSRRSAMKLRSAILHNISYQT